MCSRAARRGASAPATKGVLKGPPGTQANRSQGGLGDAGIAQGGLLGGPGLGGEGRQRVNEITQASSRLGRREGAVGLGQSIEEGREVAGQVSLHANVLRP